MMMAPETEEQRRRSNELLALVKRKQAEFDALPPEKQREHREAQRRSWVVGQFMLSNPDATREYAESIYEKVKD